MIHTKLKAFAAVACLSLLFQANHASAEKAQGSGPSPYVECGIGGALFPTTSWAAVTSNVIWDLGSTALTSALSSPEACNAKKVKTAALILQTLPDLEKDVAMGKGKYLTALMDTAECGGADQAAIASQIRTSYATALANPDYASKPRTDRAATFYNDAKAAMSNSCRVVL
jgi:hypothetical protein